MKILYVITSTQTGGAEKALAALAAQTIKEHQVKAGVQGKMFFIYGGAKTGKTTTACQFSKPLLLA